MNHHEEIEALRAENLAMKKTIGVLTRRVDAIFDSDGSFDAFTNSVLLERIVSRRTEELQRITESARVEAQERRKAERGMRRQRRLLEGVLAHIPHLISWKDGDGVYRGCNRAFAARFGLESPESIDGLTDADLGWGREGGALRAANAAGVLETGEAILDEETTISFGEGVELTFLTSLVPMRDSRGIVRGVLSIDADITERKKLELELVQARKLESIGQLAAGIAHEINTPAQYVGDNIRFLREEFGALLGAFRTYEELLDPTGPDRSWEERSALIQEMLERVDLEFLLEEIPKAMEQSKEGIERISHIVIAMKEFSHPGTSVKEFADLNHAIRSTATVCSNRWKYSCDLTLDLDEDAPEVPCFLGEFNQTVLNLIVNSVDAIESRFGEGGAENARGSIVVSTRGHRDGVMVEVRDNGGGIPVSIRERIFDPFFTTKEVGKGTGQGLAICRDVIVEKHGGTLEYEVEEGEGTTFRMWIPLEAGVGVSRAA